jgi:hypothetical protein
VEQLHVMMVLDDLIASLHTCLHTAWRWFTDGQPDELPPQPPAGNNDDPMDVDLNGWLVVYANKGFPAEFIPGGEAAVHARFGDHTPERRQGMGMWNHHLGKDKVKGNFCVLPLESACRLVDLIVRTLFIRFGDVAYHQTTGIPMGVNPGVFLANLYLYDHEMKWLSQVHDLLQRFPPALQTHMGKFPDPVVETIIDIEDQEYLLEHATTGQIGDAVLYVLFWFQFMARYVDDIITGPNKYIRRLVHVTDTLLGGLLKGFYPPYLNLKETKSADADGAPHAPRQCHALDVTIVSKPVTASSGDVVMFASTQHFDKRREPCFSGLPVYGFSHVSSNVADSVHSSVQISALQRCGGLRGPWQFCDSGCTHCG